MVPLKSGNLLVWDATCSDTYASSHLVQSNMEAGDVASHAGGGPEKGQILISGGTPTHIFHPIAIKMSGVLG